MVGTKSDGRHGVAAIARRQWSCDLLACPLDISLSVQAMPMADRMNTQWMMVCHITPVAVALVHKALAAASSGVQSGRPSYPASMNVFSRWIEELPMIAIASFTLSTLALTWLSHSGWSGWPSRFSRDTKVS